MQPQDVCSMLLEPAAFDITVKSNIGIDAHMLLGPLLPVFESSEQLLYVACSHQDLQAEIAQDIERALPPLPRDPSGMKIGIQRTVNQLLDLPEMQKVR